MAGSACDRSDRGASETGVSLLNSFTRRTEPVQLGSGGRRVGMYVCGPTVYDSAHLGHARNYVAFDTLRRVLRDAFSLDVRFVMNITDVDDKIVMRAHMQRAHSLLSLTTSLAEPPDSAQHLNSLLHNDPNNLKAIFSQCHELASSLHHFRAELSNEQLSELDALSSNRWNVKAAAQSISREYERSFSDNMRKLNVEPPDAMPRVSEHMPEITECIQRIVDKGFAYECNGSVYFNTVAFNSSPGHRYGKLRGSAMEDVNDAMQGEGSLSPHAFEKRHRSDFALWKAAREGEPTWSSTFGPGRPGWHIECSAMCSHLLGNTVEINAGGCDLEFPHHENQVAQSEAYWGSDQWTLSFVHAGHLHISGQKMSKSLKNFVTIDAALQKHSWRTLRMLFLLKQWSEPMEITPCEDGTILQAPHAESMLSSFDNFLDTCDFHIQQRSGGKDQSGDADVFSLKWSSLEFQLERALKESKHNVYAALANNVQTPHALKETKNLVHETNNYLQVRFDTVICKSKIVSYARDARTRLIIRCHLYAQNVRSESMHADDLLLADCKRFVSHILDLLGLAPEQRASLQQQNELVGGQSKKDVLLPYIDMLCQFRQTVRRRAKESGDQELLNYTDWLRDQQLPQVGVSVDDVSSTTMW